MLSKLFHMADPDNTGNYLFKDLKLFSSVDAMIDNSRRYRSVYIQSETDYLYAELSIHNKCFDKKDWKGTVTFKGFELRRNSREEIFSINAPLEASKTDAVIVIREGWGTPSKGSFWKYGDYEWEAYIDGVFVGRKVFYLEDVIFDETKANPYFDIQSLKLYEGSDKGVLPKERIYKDVFIGQELSYVWVELTIANQVKRPWCCELFYHYYDLKTGWLKGMASEFIYIKEGTSERELLSGWGAENKGSWHPGEYRLSITFMDRIICNKEIIIK